MHWGSAYFLLYYFVAPKLDENIAFYIHFYLRTKCSSSEGRIIMTPIPGQRIRISSVEGKNKEQNHLVESTETSSATH